MLRFHISSTAIPTLVSGPLHTADWVITSLTFIIVLLSTSIRTSPCHIRASIRDGACRRSMNLRKGRLPKANCAMCAAPVFSLVSARLAGSCGVGCKSPQSPCAVPVERYSLGPLFSYSLPRPFPWMLDLYLFPVHIAVTRVTPKRALGYPFLARV